MLIKTFWPLFQFEHVCYSQYHNFLQLNQTVKIGWKKK